MSELAYNINGEGFDLPETATGWRVRRMKPRGAPEVVYGKDGLPVTIPIEADLDDLRASVDTAGRFRLDAIDDRGRNVDGAQPAYVVVAQKPNDVTVVDVASDSRPGNESVVAEAMRLNAELARSVIDRFPEMMHAAAELLRAADGAGLPARVPRVADHDDGGDDDDQDDVEEVSAAAASPTFDFVNTLVAQIVPMLINGMSGKKMPKLAAVLDWRKAQPNAEESSDRSQAGEVSNEEPGEPAEPPPLDPKMMGHIIAIQSALAPAEAALARQLAAELTPAEQRAWFHELTSLSVPDAVSKVRSLLNTMSKKGGAS